MMIFRLSTVVILSLAAPAQAFSSTLFPQAPTAQQTFPSKTDGVEIELPDFDDLFGRIQQVSPLARVAIEGGEINGKRGFAAIDNTCKLTIRISRILENYWLPYYGV
jgi:hypothetical protein